MSYSFQAELSRALQHAFRSDYFFFIVLSSALCLLFLLSSLRPRKAKPPLAPNAVPILGHSALFMGNPTRLASVIAKSGDAPISRFKLPFQELWLTTQTRDIRSVLMNPKLFDGRTMKTIALSKIIGSTRAVLRLVNEDDSGFGTRPVLDSKRDSRSKRFNYVDHTVNQDLLRPGTFAAFTKKFEENLHSWMDNCNIIDEWTTLPDLYLFIRDAIFTVGTDAFFGPYLLKQNPNFAGDFWTFEKNVPKFAKGLPMLFDQQPAKARKKCIEGIVKWRAFALKDKEKYASLPEWNPLSGLRCITLRKESFEDFELDEVSCATTDFGVLFGLNSNSAPATFWLIFEIIQSRELSRELSQEIASARITSGCSPHRFDVNKLLELPLLQSVYAETLRLYVTIMFLRRTRQNTELGGWSIPKNQDLLVCSYSQHMNEELWNPTGDPNYPSLEKFWGHRFLMHDDTNTEFRDQNHHMPTGVSSGCPPKFSTRSVGGGRWLPFGLGETMCPGRHMVKFEMMFCYAVLNSTFEIELLKPNGWRPDVDMNSFGYGAMAPKSPTPFRIRRRR